MRDTNTASLRSGLRDDRGASAVGTVIFIAALVLALPHLPQAFETVQDFNDQARSVTRTLSQLNQEGGNLVDNIRNY